MHKEKQTKDIYLSKLKKTLGYSSKQKYNAGVVLKVEGQIVKI